MRPFHCYSAISFVHKFNIVQALDMIINIHAGMKDNVEESNWLDVQSKALIREKLNSMKFIMGFPTWYKNETAIVNYYEEVR